jgi:L-threonylcarbamoyladenylate synthase
MMVPFQTREQIEAAIPRVASHLAEGRLLGYPTETVYGLGSNASVPALEALAHLKGRQVGKPFLLLVSGRPMAEAWGLVFTASARALSDAFWPGPLTLVLKGGEGGIAVRHTSHRGIERLVAQSGQPLTSTSANRPGGPPAPGADKLAELFQAEVDSGLLLVLDGGVLGNVPPSTLVDCTDSVPRMVREGAIPRAELRRAAGRLAP